MSNNQDPLDQLWQLQDVVQPDILDVSKKWRKVRLKQRCYVVLDLFSLAIPFAIIWFNYEKLDRYTMMLLISVMTLSVIGVAYITWLRRFSFGWSNASTDEHIQKLLKQIEGNIKIANLSLYSVWFVVLLMFVFYGAMYYYEVFPLDQLMRKIFYTVSINAIALPCIWVWASKRKKRFDKELTDLIDVLAGSKI